MPLFSSAVLTFVEEFFSVSQGYCSSSGSINAANTVDDNATYHGSYASSRSQQMLQFQDSLSNSLTYKEETGIDNPSDARVMLIDGTSIIYRAYYKLLGMLELSVRMF